MIPAMQAFACGLLLAVAGFEIWLFRRLKWF